jgi:4-diphosphocytidyl-2-C-methyl-D-erythritol kinase
MRALYDVPAPAKLNLFLHITGRREDGYHLLQSVFMLIDWHDTLNFEVRRDGLLSRQDEGTALPEDDLILRAARALQTLAPKGSGAHIVVHKRIPAQAGMGGGSSDAASCLLALNRLWKLNLPLEVLCTLGLKLGADVPFFLRGRNAWVEGVGERMTPVELPSARFLVVKPPQGLPTAAVFNHPLLKRDSEPATILGFAADPFGFGQNDLQAAALALCPPMADCLHWLQVRGLNGRMTGSGSAVFAPLRDAAVSVADHAVIGNSPRDWQLRECVNLVVHPLVGWASSEGLSVGCE